MLSLGAWGLLNIFACERPKEIGLNLQPQGKAGVFFTDTCKLQLSTIVFDSVATDPRQTPVLLVGKYEDPELGKITARCFFQPVFVGASVAAAEGTVEYDSLSLILAVGSESNYGNLKRTQKAYIYRLQERPDEDLKYQFNSLPYDNSKLLGKIEAKPEEVIKQSLLRIKLDDDLGREFASYAQQKISRETYLNTFKGLAIVEDATNDCVWGFSALSSSSILRLYYKIAGEGIQRTLDFNIQIGTRFNQIISDRSNTVLAPFTQNYQIIPPQSVGFKAFQQYETGLINRIDFPSVFNLKKLGNTLAINKAEIVLRTQPNSTQNFAVPNAVALYETNDSNRILFVTNAEGRRIPKVIPVEGTRAGILTIDPASGTFSNARQEYRIEITTYLQQLLRENSTNKSILVLGSQGNQLKRVIFNANPNDRAGSKIEITYTLFDKK